MKKIWIDCDPGHDDAMAILVALANPSKLDVIGISTIGGNESLEKVTRNAKNVLSMLNADVPLIKGKTGPLVKELQSAPDAHGESGMDGITFETNDYPILEDNLFQYMYKKMGDCDQKIDLVAIGPLTNIALLLKIFPDVKKKINSICIMGGGLDHGNVTRIAEFNIYVDPEAAKIVFNSGIKIIMAGLDVTEKSFLTREEIDSLKLRGKISKKIFKLLDFYNKSGKQFGFEVSPIHDLCTIVYLLDENVFSGSRYAVDVITDSGEARGMTIADKRKKPDKESNVYVLLNSDREKYVSTFMNALDYFDQKNK